MTIIKLKGGLGNQLFQYAFGRSVSTIRGEELLLDTDILEAKGDTYRKYGLKYFNIKARTATDLEVKKNKYPLGIMSKFWRWFSFKILRIQNIGWNSEILKSKKSYLDGFWQSHGYFENLREELLKELTLKESLDSSYSEILENMDNTESVSIHIRRGDYVTNPETSKAHNICDLDYYKKAIKILSTKLEKPNFFVFSDDIEWVKENLKTQYPIMFVSNSSMKDYEELVMMSKCKNNIIANSSFSWWGAWLNNNINKIVVSPERWNNHHPEEYKYLSPNDWIKI